MKKQVLAMVATVATLASFSLTAMAKTVYYNGDAVYWNYGRSWVIWSFSEVQTSVYEHTATANSVSSGWKAPCVKAYAEDCIGTATAYCYWNCR